MDSDDSGVRRASRGRVFTWRRWEIYALGAGLVAVLVLFVGGPQWLDYKLHREVDRFGVPPTMRLTERHTTGDFFCVITCLGKSTELVFETTSDASATCRVLQRHLTTRGYNPEPPPSYVVVPAGAPCFYWTKAGRIRGKATLTATVTANDPRTGSRQVRC